MQSIGGIIVDTIPTDKHFSSDFAENNVKKRIRRNTAMRISENLGSNLLFWWKFMK